MIRRQTKQRDHIYRAICELGHADIPHIKEHLQNQNVDIPISTLYRNLTVLLNEGLIRLVYGNEIEVYEATDCAPHHHFHCQVCGNIYDVTTDQIKIVYEDPTILEGYIIEKESVLLHGICPRCGKKK